MGNAAPDMPPPRAPASSRRTRECPPSRPPAPYAPRAVLRATRARSLVRHSPACAQRWRTGAFPAAQSSPPPAVVVRGRRRARRRAPPVAALLVPLAPFACPVAPPSPPPSPPPLPLLVARAAPPARDPPAPRGRICPRARAVRNPNRRRTRASVARNSIRWLHAVRIGPSPRSQTPMAARVRRAGAVGHPAAVPSLSPPPPSLATHPPPSHARARRGRRGQSVSRSVVGWCVAAGQPPAPRQRGRAEAWAPRDGDAEGTRWGTQAGRLAGWLAGWGPGVWGDGTGLDGHLGVRLGFRDDDGGSDPIGSATDVVCRRRRRRRRRPIGARARADARSRLETGAGREGEGRAEGRRGERGGARATRRTRHAARGRREGGAGGWGGG